MKKLRVKAHSTWLTANGKFKSSFVELVDRINKRKERLWGKRE